MSSPFKYSLNASNEHRLLPDHRPIGICTDEGFYSRSPAHEEYEILVQFELKREKEKTRILQERLLNKETFIIQMKQFQDELTFAFQRCQKELAACKKQLEGRQSYEHSGQKDARNYLEQISDLKHLVIRLEQEINYYESKMPKTGRPIYRSGHKEGSARKRNVKQRAKTLPQQDSIDQHNPKLSSLERQVAQSFKKIARFLGQFMNMVQFFHPGLSKQKESVKDRLKVSWKWIKSVVSQWYQQKHQMEQLEAIRTRINKVLCRQLEWEQIADILVKQTHHSK